MWLSVYKRQFYQIANRIESNRKIDSSAWIESNRIELFFPESECSSSKWYSAAKPWPEASSLLQLTVHLNCHPFYHRINLLWRSLWTGLFLAAVGDLLATSYGLVSDKSAGKLTTSRTSPRGSYGEVADKSCRVVSCRVVSWRRSVI